MRSEYKSDVTEADGTRIITTAKGVVVILKPDGSKEIRKADNVATSIFPDGTRRTVLANGEVVEILPPEKRPINVISTSTDDAARILSNFAHTPFMLDNLRYHSIEGFYVGLKFSEAKKRREIAKLFGADAKSAGKGSSASETVYNGTTIVLGSLEHHALLKRALRAKFEQNTEAKLALIGSYPREIIHDTGRPDRPNAHFPAVVFCRILTELREEFRARHD